MAPPITNYHHFIASKSKRPTLIKAFATVILCSIFYLIGFYQNTRGSVPTKNDADGGDGVTVTCLSSAAAAFSSLNLTLDFSPHHRSPDPPPHSAVKPLPPCDPSFTEYTPCEDVHRSLRFDRDRLIYRERHCPEGPGERLTCRVPAPHGYRLPLRWPESREFAWYANVPHKELTVEKRNQNWVHFEGDRFRFPGGGTMFPRGADAYIDDIGKLINLKDGSVRTAIDTGCGVASFGAYLLSRNILTVSFAPRDTHEAQVQFALERGVPALIGILASIRLPYPSRAFDIAHCSRCLIPWGQFDGQYLLEVDRVLRPGGYWILSGPPINWEGHYKGWNRTRDDLKSICWKKLVQKNDIAIWQKPTNHIHCKATRKVFRRPGFCTSSDPDQAWYTKMETCITPLPEASDIKETAGGELTRWPERLNAIPPRITRGDLQITPEKFHQDGELWQKRVAYYKKVDQQLGQTGRYRNLLDMNAGLGGFAAAMVHDPVWVMNVVPVESKINTLGVIYERGLIGTYQNWCEAMSTYPRTYDFIHADSIFSLYENNGFGCRCEMEDILLEMDRVLRPQGSVIIREDVDVLVKVKAIIEAMQWEGIIADHEFGPKYREKVLFASKKYWTAPPPQTS
ncbi:Probable methyltransferase PMT15 [Linum grandiflorum]